VITDGAFNFSLAIRRACRHEAKQFAIQHVSHVRFQGDNNNNKMERFNGEVRDREKIVRGVKKSDSPPLGGYRSYHNYVRPHIGLNGKTPAEVAGIIVEGNDKWLTIIQNAKKRKEEQNASQTSTIGTNTVSFHASSE
jgi:hypothetical protein